MREEDRHRDPLYQEMRKVTHCFREGLLELFFDRESGLDRLTKLYGVF